MNELVTMLNQVLNQRFPEYNRTLIKLLKIDIQIIVSIASSRNSQDENVINVIKQLNDLLNSIDKFDPETQEFLVIAIRHHLREILNNARGSNRRTETE